MDKRFLLTYEYEGFTGNFIETFAWFETEDGMNEYIKSERYGYWVVIEKIEILQAREVD